MRSISLRTVRMAAAVTILFAVEPVSSQTAEPEDWEWMDKSFPLALDELMPMKKPTGTSVAFRSYKDYHTWHLEYSFLFDDSPFDKEIEATIQVADTTSIFQQLLKLHLRDRRASLDDLLPKIKMKKWTLTSNTCAAVPARLAKLRRLKLQVPANHFPATHPRISQFNINSMDGEMTMELPDDPHPLLQWAWETKKALETCTGEAVELVPPDERSP